MRDNQTSDGTTTTNPRHALDPERGDAIDPDRVYPPGAQSDRDETGLDPADRDTNEGDLDRDTTDRDLADRDLTDRDLPDRDLSDRDLPDRDRSDDAAIGVAEAPPGAIPDDRPRDSVSPGPLDQPIESSTDPTAPVVHRDEPPPSGAGFRGPVPGSPASGPLEGSSPDGTTSLDTGPEASTTGAVTAPDSAEALPPEAAGQPQETVTSRDQADRDTDRVFPADQASGFHDRWREIQASFVDNPATAVRSADELVGEVVEALHTALQGHQRTLGEGWRDAPDAATEELRGALVRYRAVLQRIIGL